MPMGKKAEHIFKTFTFPDSVRQPEVYAATDKGADISLISESAYQALPQCPKLNLLPEVKEELDLSPHVGIRYYRRSHRTEQLVCSYGLGC